MEDFTPYPTMYRILCIGTNATKEQIRRARLDLLKIHHPDKNPNDQEFANEQSQMINLAYEILIDDIKRKKYDELLKEYEDNENRKRMEEERRKKAEEQKKKSSEEHKAKRPPNFTDSPKNGQKPPDSKTNYTPALVGLGALVLLAFLLGSGTGKDADKK